MPERTGKSITGVLQEAPWPEGMRETKVEVPERQVRWTTDAKGRRVKLKQDVAKRYTVGKSKKRVPWVSRGTGLQKQSPAARRVVIYIPPALYARLQTACYVRAMKRGTPGSLGAIVRDVLELALPSALPLPKTDVARDNEAQIGEVLPDPRRSAGDVAEVPAQPDPPADPGSDPTR